MKKILLFFGIVIFLCSVSNANNYENYPKASYIDNFKYKGKYDSKRQKNEKKSENCSEEFCSNEQKTNTELEIDDDEYYTYNLCFFDKQYRLLKRDLCLTRRQENYIDNLYLNFKFDMENLNSKYQKERIQLLKTMECNCGCHKKNISNLKEIKKEAKEKIKDFKEDINEHLCKNQKRDFKNFQKTQKKKMKKIKKYCVVYKFPCINCNSK